MYVPSPSWVDQRTHGALGSHNGWCAAMYMSDVHSSYRGRARRTQDEEAGREKAGGSEREPNPASKRRGLRPRVAIQNVAHAWPRAKPRVLSPCVCKRGVVILRVL